VSGYRTFRSGILDVLKEVRFYDETIAHIEGNHPEVPINLPSLQLAVENAVSQPTHVEESYGNSVVFIDASSTNASGDPLRVPVKIVTEGTGRVKTVLFASSTASRKVLWRRSDG